MDNVTPADGSGDVTPPIGSEITLDDAVEQLFSSQQGDAEETEGPQEGDGDQEEELDVEEVDEGDEGEEAEAEESEEGDPEPEPQTIEIDGEKITLEEARKGYLRDRDYTHKTERLARERDSFEAEKGRAMEYLVEQIQQAEMLVGPKPQWADFKDTDPLGYNDAVEEWEQKQAKLNNAKNTVTQTRAKAFQQAQAETVERLMEGEYNPHRS